MQSGIAIARWWQCGMGGDFHKRKKGENSQATSGIETKMQTQDNPLVQRVCTESGTRVRRGAKIGAVFELAIVIGLSMLAG